MINIFVTITIQEGGSKYLDWDVDEYVCMVWQNGQTYTLINYKR
jgi:hypothetical protein